MGSARQTRLGTLSLCCEPWLNFDDDLPDSAVSVGVRLEKSASRALHRVHQLADLLDLVWIVELI